MSNHELRISAKRPGLIMPLDGKSEKSTLFLKCSIILGLKKVGHDLQKLNQYRTLSQSDSETKNNLSSLPSICALQIH